MFKALYTAASGMFAQQRNVEVVANNLANVNTTAFKRSDAVFADLYYADVRAPGAPTASGGSLAGIQLGGGSTIVATMRDQTTGNLYQTSRPFDIAIAGEGFFELENPGGQPLYTRAGTFVVDRDGSLVTPSGRRLAGGPAGLQGAVDVAIAPDGRVSGYVNGVETDLGQLQIAVVPNPAGLSSEGENAYRTTDVSGVATRANPGELGSGRIQQGWLERSNVDIANELI
jgi:flagellar basal-body rod protein FlgG